MPTAVASQMLYSPGSSWAHGIPTGLDPSRKRRSTGENPYARTFSKRQRQNIPAFTELVNIALSQPAWHYIIQLVKEQMLIQSEVPPELKVVVEKHDLEQQQSSPKIPPPAPSVDKENTNASGPTTNEKPKATTKHQLTTSPITTKKSLSKKTEVDAVPSRRVSVISDTSSETSSETETLEIGEDKTEVAIASSRPIESPSKKTKSPAKKTTPASSVRIRSKIGEEKKEAAIASRSTKSPAKKTTQAASSVSISRKNGEDKTEAAIDKENTASGPNSNKPKAATKQPTTKKSHDHEQPASISPSVHKENNASGPNNKKAKATTKQPPTTKKSLSKKTKASPRSIKSPAKITPGSSLSISSGKPKICQIGEDLRPNFKPLLIEKDATVGKIIRMGGENKDGWSETKCASAGTKIQFQVCRDDGAPAIQEGHTHVIGRAFADKTLRQAYSEEDATLTRTMLQEKDTISFSVMAFASRRAKEKTLAGTAVLTRARFDQYPNEDTGVKVYVLALIAVERQWRGFGLGRRILARVEKELRETERADLIIAHGLRPSMYGKNGYKLDPKNLPCPFKPKDRTVNFFCKELHPKISLEGLKKVTKIEITSDSLRGYYADYHTAVPTAVPTVPAKKNKPVAIGSGRITRGRKGSDAGESTKGKRQK